MNDPATDSSQTDAIIVKAENLGKCYRIFDRPKDRLKQTLFQNRRQYYREFWALRHVEFELRRGETLGIIGRNGSGKSTLLQLLCGTLTPTEGRTVCHGRVAALLELGSGFNPEFTGLENVYLYASLLGLKRQETEKRLDAILAFADIGEFARQPVKTYSSGMAVRLAFAVIANVDADILVVDEALSVGDVFFVQKCMRFIQKFKEENTLILVTHDSQAALTVCSHGIVLSNGRMLTTKIPAKKAIQSYVDDFYRHQANSTEASLLPSGSTQGGTSAEIASIEDSDSLDSDPSLQLNQRPDKQGDARPPALIQHGASREEAAFYGQKIREAVERRLSSGMTLFTEIIACEESGEFQNGECRITTIQIANQDPAHSTLLAEAEKVQVIIKAICLVDIVNPILGFVIRNRDGLPILGENTYAYRHQHRMSYNAGQMISARFLFTMPRMSPGQYTIHTAIARGTQTNHVRMHYFHDVCAFEIVSTKPCHALSCPSDMMVEVF